MKEMKIQSIAMKQRTHLISTALFLLLSYGGYAQMTTDTAMLREFVVTAARTPQSRGNITQKIDILTAREIGTVIAGNRNIAEVLQNQPGASVTVLSRNDANWGTSDGAGPKYSTYMLQGLPVDAYMDPMALDLSAVSRIEIQKGPASVLYPGYLSQDFAGNQSPLAGTVNMILRERVEKPESRFSLGYGTWNTLTGQVWHQDHIANMHYFGGISYEMSDYTDYGMPGSWLNMQKDPEYRKTKVFAGVTWYSNDDRQKLGVFLNRTFHTGDAGRIYRGFDHDYGLLNTGYTWKIRPAVTLRADLGYRSYHRTWQESNFNGIDSLVSDNGAVQQIVPAGLSVTIAHGKSWLLTAGADYQAAGYFTVSDPKQGYDSYGNKSKATLAGIYAQEELRLGKFLFRAGLRGNYSGQSIELLNGLPPASAFRDWFGVIYSLGVKFRLNDLLSFYANAGNSFIAPGLKSTGGTIRTGDTLHSGQLPNPDLKPENGIGSDAGADLLLRHNLKLGIRGFLISVEEAIIENVIRQNPSQTMSVNAGRSRSAGLEAAVSHSVSERLSWFFNLTYTSTRISNPYDPDQDGARIPFAPEWVANAGFDLETPFGLQLIPSLGCNDGYYDSSSKSNRRKFTPGVVVNVFASQRLVQADNASARLFGKFSNVTNNRYEMPWQFRNTGFSFIAGLEVTF